MQDSLRPRNNSNNENNTTTSDGDGGVSIDTANSSNKKKMYSAGEVEAIKDLHEKQMESKENEHQDQLDQVTTVMLT